MTGMDDDEFDVDESGLAEEGGFTPEGPDEELVTDPAGAPGPFDPDGPISRVDVLARAQSWIDEKVPYSQATKHTNDFGSYRADCSGFVSMAWRLSASLTTFSLPNVMDEIDWPDLQPGDALWHRVGEDGHIAMFLRWANSDRTLPVVQEEFDFGQVASERTWPKSWAADFFPRRYRNITGGAAAKLAKLGDGSLVQAQGTPVAVLAGSARITLRDQAEVAAIGAAGRPVGMLSKEAWNDLPIIPDDGTLLSGAPGLPVALIVGTARVNLGAPAEIVESGHGGQHVQPIPARAFRALNARIADGTLIGAPELPVALIVGGGRVNLANQDEIAESGHAGDPVRRVPRRVFNSLSGRIGDGTLVTAAGLPTAIMAGGGRINFADRDEIVATRNTNRAIRRLPRRVFNGLTDPIADGTLIAAPGLPVAVIVGGARINLGSPAEIVSTGHRGQPVTTIPERVFTALETTMADGTLVRTPSSATVWRIASGHRTKVGGGAAQFVPDRVLTGIPVA